MAKKILFLCGHNAGRSQMAQGMFNHYNKNKEYECTSAGTMPGDEINQTCVQAMKEIDIDISDKSIYYPKAASMELLNECDRIYSMGCNIACSLTGIPINADWELEDPNDQSIEKVREIRDKVKEKVLSLINELKIPKQLDTNKMEGE